MKRRRAGTWRTNGPRPGRSWESPVQAPSCGVSRRTCSAHSCPSQRPREAAVSQLAISQGGPVCLEDRPEEQQYLLQLVRPPDDCGCSRVLGGEFQEPARLCNHGPSISSGLKSASLQSDETKPISVSWSKTEAGCSLPTLWPLRGLATLLLSHLSIPVPSPAPQVNGL